MQTVNGFPFRGYIIYPRTYKQASGKFTADVTVQEGDGSGPTRYAASLSKHEFDTEALAKDNALTVATEWVNQFPKDI